ncbi:SPFH domain-containing protein [Sphaerimonospora sp. CA-214678]|uniref:SPFH domain-containing protein n=1 Tax=Sphaerimonospora sp. CA-214678 TaxID=3240029 RepID=UPI003D8A1AD1
MDRIRGEFIDIIEWTDDSRDTIVWRFPRYENEIKMGARLVVRESQAAVFVNEGRIADVFVPGTYVLETRNLPLLSTLKGWKHGFHSPFKAEVYFVNTRQFTDLKWGTQNPIMLRDPEFGMVRLRAFGGFAVQITDPAGLLRELAGTDPRFRTEEVREHLRQMIVSRLANALATANIPVLDLASRQDALGARLAGLLTHELTPVGVSVPAFFIENISLPPEVEAAVDARTRMAIAGDLDQYTRFQAANAIGEAARNPGGAGEGIGLGVGMALGQQLGQQLGRQLGRRTAAGLDQGPQPAPGAGGPPPLPSEQRAQWYVAVDGRQQGPYETAALPDLAGTGALTRATLVWRTGMPGWLPAEQVPELTQVLAAVPPPLPPQA